MKEAPAEDGRLRLQRSEGGMELDGISTDSIDSAMLNRLQEIFKLHIRVKNNQGASLKLGQLPTSPQKIHGLQNVEPEQRVVRGC